MLSLQPDWRGEAPKSGKIRVTAQAGADQAPADPAADRSRLLSFIRPDQTERLARMNAALCEAARIDPGVERADAADFLDRRTSNPHPGAVHMVFNTVAWQYFPRPVHDRATAILEKAGAMANWGAPLAHVAMESDGTGSGASLRLTLWPDGTCHEVGRADFHGRWIDWRPPSL